MFFITFAPSQVQQPHWVNGLEEDGFHRSGGFVRPGPATVAMKVGYKGGIDRPGRQQSSSGFIELSWAHGRLP
jgi:hypothetical protein